MMRFEIEFIRHMPGYDEPAVIDVHNLLAADLDEAIRRAALSLLTLTFRVRPESFRIREEGGDIVF